MLFRAFTSTALSSTSKNAMALIVFLATLIFLFGFDFKHADIRDAMVKIYTVKNEPDQLNPWSFKGPKSINGSGCIIEGRRILTNAHVVTDQTFVQVRRHGRPERHTARILAVAHEVDLALMTVDEVGFFDDVKPIALGELPDIGENVVVFGFPQGGDTLSTTAGVLSRIEHQRYVHSYLTFLAGQVDAAVNPGNSGGPVVCDGKLVGVVMQMQKNAHSIGYMVPVPLVKHFLEDLKDGRYDGYPESGLVLQRLDNPGLRRQIEMKTGQSGVLVLDAVPGSPAHGKLIRGDVVLSVDGHTVANDATVEFRPKERTSLNYFVQQKQIGESLKVVLLREGSEKEISLSLDKPAGACKLVPFRKYEARPAYYIYGGLIFQTLTYSYFQTIDEQDEEKIPVNLLPYHMYDRRKTEGEEVVILSRILPSEVNHGYERFVDKRIVEVNGNPIVNFRDLVRLIEEDPSGFFVVFKTEHDQVIAIDRVAAEADRARILAVYNATSDRSPDLVKTAAAEESPRLSLSY
jgi:S1-C subfamily serine protease